MNFTTERLYIRPIRIEDKESIFKYRSDPDANKYQGWIPKTIEGVSAFIKKTATTPDVPGTWFQLVILQKTSNQIIGDIGIHFLSSDTNQVEIGFTLDRGFQGLGFATESLRKTIDHIFFELKKHRIVSSIDPENTKSIKLIERLGFRKEAHFVESIFMNGKWADDVVFAILHREWESENPN